EIIREVLIKKPRNPEELKNIIRKNDDVVKAAKPKQGPKTSAEKIMGISEKSNFKKGNVGNIGTRPNQAKVIEIAINAEL
ncbi:MAG: hypothetical protein IKE05_02820, partial [Clostridia bacterium]|nr:hypothetical protein [Clostridia bacterium]